MDRRIYKIGYVMLFVPTALLVSITLFFDGVQLMRSLTENIAYLPSITFTFGSDVKFGWAPAELVIITQSMWIIIQAFNDYYSFGDANHRTDNMNKLIKFFGIVGLAYFVHALMGCSYWIENREYALIDYCFNTFVACVGMNVMRMELADKRVVQGFAEAGYECADGMEAMAVADAERESMIEELNLEAERKRLAEQPVIDFASKPEIPTADPLPFLGSADNAHTPEAGKAVPTQKDLLVLQLRELIEQKKIYLQAGIRIDDMALMLGTNRTYLARMMKENYGHTFAEYMNICRLKSAQVDMLQRRDASVETIALANGFNSSNTFTKVFNQYYGCSPAVWRKKNI